MLRLTLNVMIGGVGAAPQVKDKRPNRAAL
jgi:hypothetical protein